ncbi:Nicotinamide/nicotinic acid mononucleotide adenylyltransferase [Citrus sinensis]|uniref:Nicotinamide/nicotinic acid mononucleotide adenylyltransferase n=1 Tax=Citrus sinensis TaxID=2711 RepID=A0ACB8P150_CITSI|nr:Nicotinamide/nicotinic acid mononucleotide adenylyltransferase [Citrus sinensis]
MRYWLASGDGDCDCDCERDRDRDRDEEREYNPPLAKESLLLNEFYALGAYHHGALLHINFVNSGAEAIKLLVTDVKKLSRTGYLVELEGELLLVLRFQGYPIFLGLQVLTDVASRASKREDGDDALWTMPIDERFIKILYKATRWEMQLNFKFEEHGSHLAIISSLNSFSAGYLREARLEGAMDVPLPLEKLSLESKTQGKTYVVLVATGSFNPPTFMHLQLARDTLNSEGYCVIGGYMSPVNDAYKKRGLISAEHRINLCNLACKSSDFIMVDPWEANQSGYQRTLTVLSRVKNFLIEAGLISTESLKVMLVCGSDLLESFAIPGFWMPEQGNIKLVDELVPNQISSTRIRDCICRGLSIKYLTEDKVIDYIRESRLYLNSNDS